MKFISQHFIIINTVVIVVVVAAVVVVAVVFAVVLKFNPVHCTLKILFSELALFPPKCKISGLRLHYDKL